MNIEKFYKTFSLHDCELLKIEIMNNNDILMKLILDCWIFGRQNEFDTTGRKEAIIFRNAGIIDLYIRDEGGEYDDIEKYYQSINYQESQFIIYDYSPISTSINNYYSTIEIYGQDGPDCIISMKIKCESIDWETEWWKELIRKKEADG